MEIAVNEGLGFADKFLPEACRGNFEARIAAQGGHQRVKVRGGMMVARANEVRVRENEIHADADERLICGEQRNSVQLALERPREIGGKEAGAGDILADVVRDVAVAASRDQAVSQDDMGR